MGANPRLEPVLKPVDQIDWARGWAALMEFEHELDRLIEEKRAGSVAESPNQAHGSHDALPGAEAELGR